MAVDNFYKIYDRKVKARMAELGIGFQELAQRMSQEAGRNISRSYAHHIVLGRRPGRELVPVLAKALGVSVSRIAVKVEGKPQESQVAA